MKQIIKSTHSIETRSVVLPLIIPVNKDMTLTHG